MPFRLLNRVQMTVSGTPGTGQITLGSAATGYQSFAAAGINDGDTVRYLITDGANWEIGLGTYVASGTKLSRTQVIESTSGGSAITANSASVVEATAAAQDIANGWTALTFTNTVTIFGTAGVYQSNETLTAAAGDFIEIEAYIYKIGSNYSRIGISPDATNGYMLVNQLDGNDVYYTYASGSATNKQASGSNAAQTWTGKHVYKLSLNVQNTGSTNNTTWGQIDAWVAAFFSDSSVSFVAGNQFYVQTDDITQCSVRARVVAANMFTG